MARGPTQSQLYDELLTRYGRDIADAFQAAIQDLRNAADLQRVMTAIDAGDLTGAVEAMHIDAAAYGPLLDAIGQAYTGGGSAAASFMPRRRLDGTALVIRFNVRDARAEQWLRDHGAKLVIGIVDDQRLAVRQALEAGLSAGANPRSTALDIIGRVDRSTGARQGGILGLTSTQEQWARNARAELTSGDPAQLRAYLQRDRRDRRFDAAIRTAIRDGGPVPADVAAKAVTRYRARLLQLRGELIGKEESFRALAASKEEAFRQGIDRGSFRASEVTKKWRHFPNEHPRHQHMQMNGKAVGLNDFFVLPDGTRMRFPHDPEAPLSQTAGCHCQADYKVDFLANVA